MGALCAVEEWGGRGAGVYLCGLLTSFPGGAQPYDLGDLEHVRDIGRVYELILQWGGAERGGFSKKASDLK